MKARFKRLLAAAGYRLEKIPVHVPSGRDLSHDLALLFRARPGPVCIDAGAHDGQFTALLQATLDQPVVHAFEPAPEPFARLRQRYTGQPRIHALNLGLSDQAGRIAFNIYDNQALNSFLPITGGANHAFGSPTLLRRQEVETVRLDDYARTNGLPAIDLLKIDTQGFERQVLRGAAGLLAAGQVHAILIEINFTPLYAGQIWGHEVMGDLFAQNLHLVDFYEKCRLGAFLGWCTALFVRRDSPLSS